jgi:hypothetical protein
MDPLQNLLYFEHLLAYSRAEGISRSSKYGILQMAHIYNVSEMMRATVVLLAIENMPKSFFKLFTERNGHFQIQ